MDAIGGLGMQGALVAQVQFQPPALLADPIDAVRFAEMVQPPAALPEAAVAPPAPTGPAATPGDSILEGMKNIGSDFRETWSAMKAAIARPMEQVTLADMLRMQMQMLQLSVQVEMAGKAISKATQNIDQLTKLQ